MEEETNLMNNNLSGYMKDDSITTIDKNETKPFFMYSKKVKGMDVSSKVIDSSNEKSKLLNVLNSLMRMGKKRKLTDLNLNFNCISWIKSILLAYPSPKDEYMGFLIRDFTDAMNTKMKEEEKYVIAIMMGDDLILCHCRIGQKTITPNWKVIERMLDKDNVMRFVSFKNDKNITVTFFEKERTQFFIDWLGIPPKEVFYEYGGENKFCSELHGIPISLELTDDDFENISNNGPFQIENSKIKLDSPIHELIITEINRGKRTYKNTKDFKDDFVARYYDLAFYQEKYKELNKGLAPISVKIYDDEDITKSPGESVKIKKENKKIWILFCNDDITIRDSFLEKIKISIINNEKKRIFHAGMKIKEEPLKIKNLEIIHKINTNLSKPLIDYYNESDHGESHKKDLRYAIFHLLYEDNANTPISTFFKELSTKFLHDMDFSSNLQENDIIELKSKDFLPKKDAKIIETLGNDIKKKILQTGFKLYIIGYDEKTKQYEFINNDRFDDSRIHNLTQGLKNETKLTDLNLFKLRKDKYNCIIMIAVKSNFSSI